MSGSHLLLSPAGRRYLDTIARTSGAGLRLTSAPPAVVEELCFAGLARVELVTQRVYLTLAGRTALATIAAILPAVDPVCGFQARA